MMSARPAPAVARSSTRRRASIWTTLLPRPKLAKHARRPPRTIHRTMARWWSFRIGLISASPTSNPSWWAMQALALRKSR